MGSNSQYDMLQIMNIQCEKIKISTVVHILPSQKGVNCRNSKECHEYAYYPIEAVFLFHFERKGERSEIDAKKRTIYVR